MTRRISLALTLLLLGACGSASNSSADGGACAVTAPPWGSGGELMLPGTDCASCHRTDGHASAIFSVAGTVFEGKQCAAPASGATIHVRDSNGATLNLHSNEVGNFVSSTALTPPLSVSVEAGGFVRTMKAPVMTGSCGSCHAADSAARYVSVR
jgi:hypothetical protein